VVQNITFTPELYLLIKKLRIGPAIYSKRRISFLNLRCEKEHSIIREYGMFKKIVTLIQLLLINITTSYGGQSLLTNQCNIETIPKIFIEGHSWVDFPKYGERKYWDNINPEIRGKIIQQGVKAIQTPSEDVKGSDYLLFKQGNMFDIVSQKIVAKKTRLEDLILAEILEGQGRFIKEICNSIWDFCSMNCWTGPEAQYLETGKLGLPSIDNVVVDELTGEIAGILSWAYYFFEKEFDTIDPNITNWIVTSVRSKFLTPNLKRYDYFWMCYKTQEVPFQTAWISYNWLLAGLMIEKDNQQRKRTIYKALECLDQFYKQIPGDGASLCGAESWQYTSGKYFQALELLEMVSVGEIDNYGDEILKLMGEYICITHIDDNYFFNYAECSPSFTLPSSLIYRFGKKVNSNMMQGFSRFIANDIVKQHAPLTGDLFNKIKFIIDYNEIMASEAREPLLSDYYMKESQVVIARSLKDSKEGFFFGVRGGSNNISGNQNEAGNFILYANGKPLIIDPGRVTMTAQSLCSIERNSIWSIQSAWHNLPTINGKMENQGSNQRATGFQYKANENEVTVSMNLAYAYELNAGIEEWIRTFTFDRKKGLDISDRFNLSNTDGETFVSFISLSKPQIKHQGVISFSVDGCEYEFGFNPELFSVEINELNTSTDSQINEWGSKLFRISLKPNSKEKTGTWSYSFRTA
jgi:hypothetical protein